MGVKTSINSHLNESTKIVGKGKKKVKIKLFASLEIIQRLATLWEASMQSC